jgi:hypothetical protein
MSWSYSASDLTTTTSAGRINTVRLLVGDTDTTDQLVQNEEITFALSQSGDNVYYAAVWICRAIAAKFSRMVTTQLDGALSANYSDKAKQYTQLAIQIEAQGKKTSGKALGISAGGISVAAMDLANATTDRVPPAFGVTQFDNVEAGDGYIPEEPNGI